MQQLSFVFALLVTALVITPPVQAAHRCGKRFKIKRVAGSKSLKRAKRIARSKASRAAQKRCGKQRRVIRLNKRWKQTCVRKGKLYRCNAVGLYRCCGKKRKRGTSNKLPKRRKLHKKHARGKRRKKRRASQSLIVRATAKSRQKAIAQKRARRNVYKLALKRCKSKAIHYLAKWRYHCHKKGNVYRCRATNTVRCHSSRRHKHRRKHRRKHKHKHKRRPSKRHKHAH